MRGTLKTTKKNMFTGSQPVPAVKKKVIILFTRHGRTRHNDEEVLSGQGSMNEPLTAEGINDAHQVAQQLRSRGVRWLYSSDQFRNVQTTEVIASYTGIKPEYTSVLREVDYGKAELMSYKDMNGQEILQKYGHLFAENIEAVEARIEEFFDLLRSNTNLRDGDVVIAVTSGGWLDVFRVRYLGGGPEDKATANGEIIEYELEI